MTYNQLVSELDDLTELGLLDLKQCIERKLEEREEEEKTYCDLDSEGWDVEPAEDD